MFLKKWDIAFILVLAALQVVLITVIFRRGLHKRWPLFFLYCCYSVFAFATLTAAAFVFRYRVFFQIHFVSQLIFVVLALLAMNEAFNQVFSVYYQGRKWPRLLMPGVVLTVMAISLMKWFQHVPAKNETLWTAFTTFDLGGDYVRAAVFALFGILVIVWHPAWHPRAFAVMKGFGFYSIVGMLGDLLRFDFGTKMNLFFSYAPSVAYIVACLIWLGAFLAPEPEKSVSGPGGLVNVAELRELLERLTKAIR